MNDARSGIRESLSIHDWLTEEGRKLYYSGCSECREMLDEEYRRWLRGQ